jgi:hypothetical protein
MATGLLGGVLPYIYSRADALKRTLGDVVSNPLASTEQVVENANDQARTFNQLNALGSQAMMARSRGLQPSPEQLAAEQKSLGMYADAYNPVGMLVGKSAKGMQELINQADLLAKQGIPDYKITEITGLERVPMGQGRMPEWGKQISDVGVVIKQDALQRLETPIRKNINYGRQTPVENITVGDLLDHPELFNAYPELKNIPAEKVSGMMFGTEAYYDPKSNIVGLKALNPYLMDKVDKQLVDSTSYLLHELQHAVQTIEGFPRGGNTKEFMKKSTERVEQELRKVDDIFATKASNLTKLQVTSNDLKNIVDFSKGKTRYLSDKQIDVFSNPDMVDIFQKYMKYQGLRDKVRVREKQVFSNYKSLAGEAQARATQKQYETGKMTVPLTTYPESYDVPVESLIYRDPFGSTTR